MSSLDDLIKEAQQNVRPASHGQQESDHVWVAIDGGRACPRGGDGSQAIYECRLCGILDYGDPAGPGFHDCFDDPNGCEGCFSIEEEMDFPPVSEWKALDQHRRYTTNHQ